MRLTIVTVVFNELEDLKKTVASVELYLDQDIEYWIIDGSDNHIIKDYLLTLSNPKINWISELDKGIYDAMNKGLERANGDYLIYMNAGDSFYSRYSLAPILEDHSINDLVVLGYSVEVFRLDQYLRPGLGNEARVFGSPSHQATLYPRSYYKKNTYRLDIPIGADADYTARAVRMCGAVFVPAIICKFELGGLSSSYGLQSIKLRMKQIYSLGYAAKLIVKIVMWNLLPKTVYYRALASSKYTKLTRGCMPILAKEKIYFSA